jgi:hypothetical protein
MAEAIFGLAGVVIGGVLTGVITYFLERHREKQEARAARRIVGAELKEATEAVEDALAGGKWPPGWSNMRWSQSWSTYRRVLAATMDDDGFAKLARAYLQMELLLTGFAAGEREFIETDKSFFARVKDSVSEAEPLLAPR